MKLNHKKVAEIADVEVEQIEFVEVESTVTAHLKNGDIIQFPLESYQQSNKRVENSRSTSMIIMAVCIIIFAWFSPADTTRDFLGNDIPDESAQHKQQLMVMIGVGLGIVGVMVGQNDSKKKD